MASEPSGQDDQGVMLKSGLLVKQGIIRKSWKARYFTLSGPNLKYYAPQKMHQEAEEKYLRGTINLAGASVKECNTQKKTYCFQALTTKRTWYICAYSKEDMAQWIDALNNAIKVANGLAAGLAATNGPGSNNNLGIPSPTPAGLMRSGDFGHLAAQVQRTVWYPKKPCKVNPVLKDDSLAVALDIALSVLARNSVNLTSAECAALRAAIRHLIDSDEITGLFAPYVPPPPPPPPTSPYPKTHPNNVPETPPETASNLPPPLTCSPEKFSEAVEKHFPAYFDQEKAALPRSSSASDLQTNLSLFAAAAQGRRPYMEDEWVAVQHLNQLSGLTTTREEPSVPFWGIYDGHSGRDAAEYTRIHLHVNIAKQIHDAVSRDKEKARTDKDNVVMQAIREAYLQTDEQYNETRAKVLNLDCGTTVVTALIIDKTLYVANAGDSRAFLYKHNGDFEELSVIHSPSVPEEKERVKAGGGCIVFMGTWRVNGIAVSRSIGDMKNRHVIIADPSVKVHHLCKEDEFLVMASDGLWDVMSPQEVGTFVRKQNSNPKKHQEDIASILVEEALDSSTKDNVTALVITLGQNH